MSLKALELQIAIPKTFDAGKQADNHHQNVLHQQAHANEEANKQTQKNRTTVLESEHLDALNEKEQQQQQEQKQQKKQQKSQVEMQAAVHPFKGNLFDFSG